MSFFMTLHNIFAIIGSAKKKGKDRMKNEINEAKRICEDYLERGVTPMDELRMLDARVKRPANLFAYVFGSISAVVMGAGMSLVMTDIGTNLGIENAMVPGIIIGIIGMALALVNYPLYKTILRGRKKKYGAKILELSERIINK